jgi:hypothetical protein
MTTEPDQQNRELVEPSQALVEQSPGQRSDGWEELQAFILAMDFEEAVEACKDNGLPVSGDLQAMKQALLVHFTRNEPDDSPGNEPQPESRLEAQASPLPETDEGWIKKWNEKYNRPYWVSTTTGESTWSDPKGGASEVEQPRQHSTEGQEEVTTAPPPALAAGWTEHWSEEHGRKYWQNNTTRKSVWHQPLEAPSLVSQRAKRATLSFYRAVHCH